MAFTIEFDYRFDTLGFFDNPDARAALEAAADLWESVILDEFDDVAAGTSLDIRNPETNGDETVVLTSSVDDIIIFVGATTLSGNVLGFAGPDGVNAAGDVFAARISSNYRGTGPVTDFEPWAGTITFDADTNWHFGSGSLARTQSDFVSVAAHEIGHILGIGTSAAFDRWIVNDVFTGPNALAVSNGAGIPIETDGAHVEDGYADETVLMDPTGTQGTSTTVSQYDHALLADIGYEIAGFTTQGFTPPIVTEGAERIFGTDTADVINGLGGNDTLQGAGGDDELRGGAGTDVLFGQSGTDTFVVSAGDGQNTISDFDLSSETIRLVDSGFATAAEAAAAVTKVASNVSQLSFEDGTTVRVFHMSQFGTPLNASHFEIDTDEDEESAQDTNSEPTGTVVIDGTPEVGRILKADTSTIEDADGLGAFSYAWLRDGVVVLGETSNTFETSELDEDAQIQVRVTYTDAKGVAHSLTSVPTDAIQGEEDGIDEESAGQDTVDDTEGDDSIADDPSDDLLSDETDDDDDGPSDDSPPEDNSGGDSPTDDSPPEDKSGSDTPVKATPFDDVFAARAGMSTIDGGDGTDTVVLTGRQDDYTLSIGPDGMTVTDKRADGVGTIELANIERIDFELGRGEGEGAEALDLTKFNGFSNLTEDEFGAFIEMYIAYFNRAPDALGLAFWATAYANGTTLEEIAELFLDQDETRDAYAEDLLSVRFVADVYNNVLGRNPDFEGLQFWRNALDSGAVGRDEFILELLRGVDAPPSRDAGTSFVEAQRADQEFLQQKTDIGILFAVERGLSDVGDAANVMALFDGSEDSQQSAFAAVEAAYSEALDPETGDFLMPLVGVLESSSGF